MVSIAMSLAELLENIRRAEQEFQRTPNSVMCLAVSKTHTIKAIESLYEQGQRHFGENYVQEAVDKISHCDKKDLIWHFIGHIQSNKTALIAQHFDWVQSLDREKIAQRLSEQRSADKPPLQVCIQVNISTEAQKSGVMLDEVEPLMKLIDKLPNLQLRGLMALPLLKPDFAQQRQLFAEFYQFYQHVQRNTAIELDTLSMGMSQDYRAAIAAGSTMIRIGTALFGPRASSAVIK